MTSCASLRLSVFLFSLAILGFSNSLPAAENWTRFRGPNGSGIATDSGAPLTWSENENKAWTLDLPGSGSSCPIVWGDRVSSPAHRQSNRRHLRHRSQTRVQPRSRQQDRRRREPVQLDAHRQRRPDLHPLADDALCDWLCSGKVGACSLPAHRTLFVSIRLPCDPPATPPLQIAAFPR